MMKMSRPLKPGFRLRGLFCGRVVTAVLVGAFVGLTGADLGQAQTPSGEATSSSQEALSNQRASGLGPKTTLVLDASGSMWGQLGGEAKITIAQRVIGHLLTELPPTRALGLTVYGHRQQGNCQDIESLVAPGQNTREAIQLAVNGLTPRGKTPLSLAVLEAAEELNYQEDIASVIVISDGHETCGLDPCAVGRSLEQKGAGFTAHVIGFDVIEADDKAQLQCLAENTGGRFFTASNADELSEALLNAAIEPVVPPELQRPDDIEEQIAPADDLTVASVEARAEDEMSLDETEGSEITSPAVDTVEIGGSAEPAQDAPPETTNAQTTDAETTDAGTTDAETTDAGTTGAETPETEVATTVTEPGVRTGEAVADPEALPSETAIDVAAEASNETDLEQSEIIEPATEAAETRDEEADPVTALPAPVDVTFRAFDRETGNRLRRGIVWSLTRIADQVSIVDDFDIAELVIALPPGAYEVRATRVEDGASDVQRIELTANTNPIIELAVFVPLPDATVSTVDAAPAGGTVEVIWSGPEGGRDRLVIAHVGSDDEMFETYAFAVSGSPLNVPVPAEPGAYEVRYLMAEGSHILARSTLNVTEVTATLAASDQVDAAATLEVTWTGPAHEGDYLTIAEPDANGDRYLDFAPVSGGTPAQLTAPAGPGTYEVRYVMRQSDRILARQPIVVIEVSAELDAPVTAEIGEMVSVTWSGPGRSEDYLTVADRDMPADRFINRTNSLLAGDIDLAMPPEPGSYEIRYILGGGNRIIARHDIEVADVPANVIAPSSPVAGGKVVVQWSGPERPSDYIAIAKPDDRGDRYFHFTPVATGSPLALQLPAEPGAYEIRYVLHQGARVLASQSVEVEDVTSTLIAPSSVEAGSSLSITWTGPDYEGDMIALARPEDRGFVALQSVATVLGSVVELEAPSEAGTYELRYVMGQTGRIVVRKPLTVTAAE